MSTPTADEAVAPRARRRSSRRNPVAPYLFLAPGMILFALCVLYPMVRSGQMSFYDWNIVKLELGLCGPGQLREGLP